MCDATPEATAALPSTVHAPSLARDFVEQSLCPRHGQAAEGAVKLVTSELVTNAVLYGHAPISLTLRCAVRDIMVEVSDASSEVPTVRGRHEGLGLLLIEKIAHDWGTTSTDAGKVVWCTVPTGVVPRRRSRAVDGVELRSDRRRHP